MESDKKVIFADGMSFKLPKEDAKDFVKGHVAIKVDTFIAFLQAHKKATGWINIDLLKSKKGSLYFKLNDWEPASKEETKGLGEGVKSEEINTAGF